jgi:cation transport ATPase
VPPGELRQQGSTLAAAAQFEQHHPIAAHLLQAAQGAARQLVSQAPEEGAQGASGRAPHAPVLEVQARGVRVCGEAQTQDALGIVARREHQ